MSFIKSLIQEDGNISLKKFKEDFKSFSGTDLFSGQGKQICFLDVETTGKNRKEDEIVELAVKIVSINEKTGEILSIIDQYDSFHDPGISITEEASAINGISDEMVTGQTINWEKVESILPLDVMELEVGYELIPLVDAERNGELLERIK